ncbi:hypothetical protein LINGRAHAP2_LOCUS26091 [Linum grandiflorum]
MWAPPQRGARRRRR